MSKASQIRQKAQELLQKGQVDKAIQEYRRLITIESKNPNLYNELGDIYLRASDREQAVQSYEKAAVIYEKVALYNNAVAVCKKILRVNPEKTETIMKLAELRAKQKLEGEAVSFFSQYVESVLAGPTTLLQRSQRDVERMIELLPANEAVLAKAVEIYEQLGMKIKTIDLYRKLAAIAKTGGNAGKRAQCQREIEKIKSSLTAEEASQVAEAESSADAGAVVSPDGASAEAGEPAVDEVFREEDTAMQSSSADAPAAPDAEAGSDAEAETETEPDAGAETEAEAQEGDETAPAPAAGSMSSVCEGLVHGAGYRGAAESGAPSARESEPSPPAAAAPEAVEEPPEPPAARAPENPPPPADSSESDDLVEEITSDVERDDLRSHYDLGMAYLEMGLYTDSIRDFQIASRCPDLQLSSMEMIGYCFLKSGQARLAVKQLQRALEIAGETGADSLGIHYNLGLAFEMVGEDARAREQFEEVYIIDMSFREVAEKMKKLSTVS